MSYIGIPLSQFAYTPEAYAYEKYLTELGYQVQLDYELDPNNDINIYFMGTRPFWEKKEGRAIEIHEYQSLSTPPYAQFKNLAKKIVNKKHPADMIFDYSGFSVIEFDGAVEELVYGESCLGVLSACSTSSLLIPACLDINSYTTETAFLGGLDHGVKKLFQKYSKNIEQLF